MHATRLMRIISQGNLSTSDTTPDLQEFLVKGIGYKLS